MILSQVISRGVDLIARSTASAASLTGLTNPDNWLTEAFQTSIQFGAQDSGVKVSGKTIQQIPAYISGLRLLSETMGILSGKMIRKTDEAITILRTDPRHRLVFKRPNSMMTSVTFWEIAVKYAVHKGNFFAVIVRDEDMNPLELIPVHETKSVKVIQYENRLYYKVQGIDQLLTEDYVFHLKGLGDGIIGIGVIEYAATTAGITLATQKNQATFFKSGSKLQGYISHPKKLSKEAQDRLRNSWHSVYHTNGGNNQTAFLDEGMQYNTITVTPEAAKYLETLKNGYYDIAAILRVPPHMLALMDRSTFNNIEHQGLEFVKYGFLTWVRRAEAELDAKLLTEQEKIEDEVSFKFNLETLLRGDYKSRMEGYRIAINTGIMSQNEARAYENMAPFEGGNEHWIQMNMMPLSMSEEVLNRAADQLALQSLKNKSDEQTD